MLGRRRNINSSFVYTFGCCSYYAYGVPPQEKACFADVLVQTESCLNGVTQENTLTSTFTFVTFISDEENVEKIRYFLEEECRLKCCIPQRNFSDQFTDDFDQAELNMMKSASTVVFLSFAAINNHQHRVERYQARHVELKRSFEHRVVYVALEDLRDVIRAGDDLHTILRYREYLQWKEDAGPRQEAAFKGRLLKKVCGYISAVSQNEQK